MKFFQKFIKSKRIIIVGLFLLLMFAFPSNAQNAGDVNKKSDVIGVEIACPWHPTLSDYTSWQYR
ncbi:MAG TPA: hypothetical protein VKA49_18715 [Flavitalea sp.]|nr:hypothetical protein [Flavitalea sp.]